VGDVLGLVAGLEVGFGEGLAGAVLAGCPDELPVGLPDALAGGLLVVVVEPPAATPAEAKMIAMKTAKYQLRKGFIGRPG
jgi:hypothetical protein